MYSVGAIDPTGVSFGGRDFTVLTGPNPSPVGYGNSFNETVTPTNQNTTAVNQNAIATNQNSGGLETRPANQSVLYCIHAGR